MNRPDYTGYPDAEIRKSISILPELNISERRQTISFRKQVISTIRFNRRIPLSKEGILRCAQNDMAAEE